MNNNSLNNHSNLSPHSPSFIPSHIDHSQINNNFNPNLLQIMSLNGYNKIETTNSILNSEEFSSIIFLQEPGFNPFTLRAPNHQNWHAFYEHNHKSIDFYSKHRTCAFFKKSFPIEIIHPLDGGSRFLSAFEINFNHNLCHKMRFINLYNHTPSFDGLALLEKWLTDFNIRNIPTFIFMDSNLHHSAWNPSNYNHSNIQSKELLKICGHQGFKIISEKHIPTYSSKHGSPTTIDLIWSNHAASKFVENCVTSKNNHNSDHQALRLNLNFHPKIIQSFRRTPIQDFDAEKFQKSLSSSLQHLPEELNSIQDIDFFVDSLTEKIQTSINDQSRIVNDNLIKAKTWWNKKLLDPIVNNRNRARRWMLLT